MAGRSRWQDGRRAWQRLNGWHQRDARATPGHRDTGEAAVRALEDVRLVRGLLDTAEVNAVHTARRHGESWSVIAVALGISRQAAWEKWHDQETPDTQACHLSQGLLTVRVSVDDPVDT